MEAHCMYKWIMWTMPPIRTFKLNTDGACKGGIRARYEGIVKNNKC